MSDKSNKKVECGLARAAQLSPEQRKEIAIKAASTRWSEKIINATHGSPDHPLTIGNVQIPCYVLENDLRVLSQSGLQTSIGMSKSGGKGGAQRLVQFLEGLSAKGIDSKALASRIRDPIMFRSKGTLIYGYEATVLADLCDVVLAARKAALLSPNQYHFAEQCEILVRGFARVGIIALVDEATGFQRHRAKDNLARILEAFVAKELQPWVKTFPTEFYEQLFRLRNLPFPAEHFKKPQYFGHLTNDIIYRRMAPGVLSEIKKQNEKLKITTGRKGKLHQHLTNELGHPKLREHLASSTTIMKLSKDWEDFKSKLDQVHPAFGDTLPMPLEEEFR